MIQNPGVCPPEGFTVLGLSTAADATESGVIGKFGSGTKHSVNLCLRNNLNLAVFCGGLKLEFFAKPETMRDGLVDKEYGKVHCRQTGQYEGKQVNRTLDLGFAQEYGVHDWTDISMALREFVSNAIDRTIREEGDFNDALKAGRLKVATVAANQVRAKCGYTRVFVPFSSDVRRFYVELTQRFLHFHEPELLGQTILPKMGRNIDGQGPMVYRCGVLVREAGGAPSAFDYNFGDADLTIDEARNVNDYVIRWSVSRALKRATVEHLKVLMRHIGDEIWEHQLPEHDLVLAEGEPERERWVQAWRNVHGDAVLVTDEYLREFVARKGYRPIVVKRTGLTEAAIQNGVPSQRSVLGEFELNRMEILTPTQDVVQAVDRVWSWMERCGMTKGKAKPSVKCIRCHMDAGSVKMGQYLDGVVYINEDVCNEGVDKALLQVALEECVHHVTGSTDMSRDFQDFLCKFVVELAGRGDPRGQIRHL